MGDPVKLKGDVRDWKTVVKSVNESFSELTTEEQSAFVVLKDDYLRGSFGKIDQDECLTLIKQMKSGSNKHPNNRELMRDIKRFSALCTTYFTDSREAFDEFQAALGLKRPLKSPTGEKRPPVVRLRHVTTPVSQRINYDNGDYYIGGVKDGQRHGYGQYFKTNGDWFEGNWINDWFSGQGTSYNAHRKYTCVGEFYMGRRTGRGEMRWPNGDRYEGEWTDAGNNGKINGTGTFYYASGKVEKGRYINGKWCPEVSSGSQRIDYRNGDYYIGDVRDGQRHGHGKHFCSNGSWFKGNWVNDGATGQGIRYEVQNGCTYTGKFYNGLLRGLGVVRWADGARYEGEWTEDNNGNPNGAGTYYLPNGYSERGRFINGKWYPEEPTGSW